MNSVGNLKLHRSKGQWLGVARALATALVLCCVAGPLHAAEEDAHVVMLYGVDPYLPPFLVMDQAVRETVANGTGARAEFFTESLDSQRFAMEPLEPELVTLLAKKYLAFRLGSAPKRCFQCCREAIMRRLRTLG